MAVSRPSLFHNIDDEEYCELAARGCIRTAEYEKDSVILHTGDRTSEFGILLSGEIHIESLDLWGNRIILHNISPGQAFAETFAFCKVPAMVDVTTTRTCRVLFVDFLQKHPYPRHDLSVRRGSAARHHRF